MDNFKIIYEDRFLLVVYKPYGMLSSSDNSIALDNLLADYRELKGEQKYIGTVHRLDRTTQGLMLYSKTKKTTAVLSEMIKNHQISKSYLCVVEGYFEEKTGTLENLIYFDRIKNKSYIVQKERKGVKDASLDYRVQNEKDDLSLLKVTLKTGRTHQIRVQFSSRRHPLVGDRRYGSKTPCSNIMLCSSFLSFVHPVTKKEMKFRYIPDNDYFGGMI